MVGDVVVLHDTPGLKHLLLPNIDVLQNKSSWKRYLMIRSCL